MPGDKLLLENDFLHVRNCVYNYGNKQINFRDLNCLNCDFLKTLSFKAFELVW